MSFVLDHVFVLTRPGAPEADAIAAQGFAEGPRNVHRGQGTANRRFFFDSTMLELLWVEHEHEAKSPPIARTALWERSRHRETGASPFGICVRGELPVETWSFRPPYLPPDFEIPVACALSIAEPLVFAVPFGRPDDLSKHPNGARDIARMRVTLAEGTPISPALEALERRGIATFVHGPEPLMEIALAGAATRGALDLRPSVPLLLTW